MESFSTSPKIIDFALVPGSIGRIHIKGLSRTKNDIVLKHIKPIFEAQTFEEILQEAQIAKEKFDILGLFKATSITIDTSKNDPDGLSSYDMFLKVQERRMLNGGISTMVGTNEGTLVGSLNGTNVYGRGERVSVDLMYGSKNAVGWNISLLKPLFLEPDYLLKGSFFQMRGDYPWSSFNQTDRGVAIDFSFPSFLGHHAVRWEGVWRELKCLGDRCPFVIREEATHNLKSSVKHTWFRDSRDSRVLPERGNMFKLAHELAGLGGDAKFLKQEAELQVNKELPCYSTLQFGLTAGVLWQPWQSTPSIMDRFFLGGPLTLRGFNLKGVGPRIGGCSLGENIYWSSGLHLYTPLPFRPGKEGFGQYFRSHFFLNAGNLASFNSDMSLKDNARQLVAGTRVSAGMGLALNLGGVARVELNYCLPLKAQASDSICPGLQVGVGVNFV